MQIVPVFHSKKRVTINESENIYIKYETTPEKELFIRSDIFKGQINNYVFKMGDKGLGYYLD